MMGKTRKEIAALLAIDLRYWADEADRRGLLRPGTKTILEEIADQVTYDAQLSIAYPPGTGRNGNWTTGH
jgi:hypothetical protein